MKLLLITESEDLHERVTLEFRPHQVEIIQYWSPLKGMDNLDEVAPDVVLFSAVDFPRHWKTFLTFLRSTYSRERMVFVLLVGDEFDADEASKAQHLGVNAVVNAALNDTAELNRLREIITRYKRLNESRATHRHIPDQLDDIDFAFAHPVNLRLVVGRVGDVSETGLRFLPRDAELTADLANGTRLTSCSLRIGDEFLTVDCTVVRNTDNLGLTFEDLEPAEQERISTYIEDHTRRAIESAASE
jgi:hypothetical protein